MEISRRLSQLNREVAQHLESELSAIVFARRCNQVATARALAEIEESGHYLRRGYRTMAEYCKALGCPADDTEMLTAAGRALKRHPALREEILTGKVLLEDAAARARAADGASGAANERERDREPPAA